MRASRPASSTDHAAKPGVSFGPAHERAAGNTPGAYEIVSPIGAGGMGEVYRARDTRLDRAVAVRILPAEFANDAKFKIRFEREAKAISALNHPHICTLYDVGDSFLVMEYCEGETLAQRLARGALPLTEALEIGVQIADALNKAHGKGIVHRDLKPGNIMLTAAGVKLLDFGLAKREVIESVSNAITVTQATEEGHIVGTVQYMAPELFVGNEVDPRSDLFALGLILYEMVTGKPAFEGASKASLIAAILEREPKPMEELNPSTPAALERLVRSCLVKNREARIQTAQEVTDRIWHSARQVGGASPDALQELAARETFDSVGARRRIAEALVRAGKYAL